VLVVGAAAAVDGVVVVEAVEDLLELEHAAATSATPTTDKARTWRAVLMRGTIATR